MLGHIGCNIGRVDDQASGPPGDQEPSEHDGLAQRLDRLEHLLVRHDQLTGQLSKVALPAWRSVTEGESRWPASVAVAAAVALQFTIPRHLMFRPHWLLPVVALLLLAALLVANPMRINRQSTSIRRSSLLMIAVLSVANAWSAVKLIRGLVEGSEGHVAGPLLNNGGAIWLTNVIIFALWYWEFDRGGPAARANAVVGHQDFLFPQMTSPELAPSDWEPAFADYFYLSFTNATAFSPTDVMPLSRWAKMAMLVQSAVSLSIGALVIARAVNILKQ